MKSTAIVALLAACLAFGGCAWLSRGVDVEVVKAQIAMVQDNISALEISVQSLTEIAEKTGEAWAITAAHSAAKALYEAKQVLPQMQEKLKNIEDGTPMWKVALTAGWPIIIAGLRFVPIVGTALAPLAELAWAAYATKQQKAADLPKAS